MQSLESAGEITNRSEIDDIPATEGDVITEDRGLTLDKVQFEMLGTAKKVSVSLDDTIILQGGRDKKLIEERCAEGWFVAQSKRYYQNNSLQSNSCHVGYTNRSLLDLWKYRIRGVRKCEKLLEMRPENSGYYVSIANMYAADGHWNMVAKVRTSMRDLGVRKAPGSTWIDMGLGFLPFMAGDTSNPHAEEIYTLLDGLNELMKDAGYVASGDLGLEVNFVEYDEQ
nr:pentatricopeptide repeat-containing protein [Quercus suber]